LPKQCFENYKSIRLTLTKLHYIRTDKKKDGDYTKEIKTYQCVSCKRCPLKIKCTKGKGNRLIELNKELKAFEKEVRENLQSELGIYLRVQRSVQVERAFGVIKEDFKTSTFCRQFLD